MGRKTILFSCCWAAIFFPSLIALGQGTSGPLPAALSLREALVTSLQQSPALRVQAATIEQKTGIFEQTSGAFDWNARGSAAVTRTRSPILGQPGTQPTDRSTDTSYGVGVARLFRNGISINPTANVGVTDSQSTAAPTIGLSNVSFAINVPLLRGLGNDSTGAVEAAARGDVRVARLLYQHGLSSQAFITAANYWSVRAADQALAVQRDVENRADRLVASTKVLVDSRIFPPAFLLQAEANLRDKRSVRIDAELAAKSARYALGRAMGLPPEQIALTPAAADEFPLVGAPIAVADGATQNPYIQRALGARLDLIASRESLVPLNILARQAEIDLRPRTDLFFSAGYRGLNEGDSLAAPLNQRVTGGNGQVGVSFEVPFHNSYQRGLLKERRGSIRLAEAQTDDLSRQVASDVLIAIEQVRLRADGVRSAQETVDLAKRAVAAQYESLRAGEGTILDVISLENLSSGARLRFISANAAYATALAQLRFALGAVFSRPEPSSESFTLNDLTTAP